jgi:predicted membrane protein
MFTEKIIIPSTLKPRFNKPVGTKYLFVFRAVILLLEGLFTMKSTTERLEIKFFIAGILLLKESLFRGFTVMHFCLKMSHSRCNVQGGCHD